MDPNAPITGGVLGRDSGPGARWKALSAALPHALNDLTGREVESAVAWFDFVKDHEGDLVVLNGLPRHVGQARGVEEIVSIDSVIHLAAEPAVLCERIRLDTGGDRSGRSDDAEEAVLRRVERFRARTRPLLERYADRVLRVPIGLETSPEAVRAALSGA